MLLSYWSYNHDDHIDISTYIYLPGDLKLPANVNLCLGIRIVAQAQLKLQLQLQLELRSALISKSPTTHPTTQPPTQPPNRKSSDNWDISAVTYPIVMKI